GLHDEVHLEPDDDRDVRVRAERRPHVVELLAQDAAAVGEGGEWLGVRPTQPRAQTGGQDYHVDRHRRRIAAGYSGQRGQVGEEAQPVLRRQRGVWRRGAPVRLDLDGVAARAGRLGLDL